MEAKSERIIRELLDEIASGRYGAYGTVFMTTRALAAYKDISLKTAFSVLGKLRDAGVLEKDGKRHVIHNAVPVRSEAGSRRLLIGMLVTSLDSPYFARLARYAEEFAHSIGASLLIASSNYNFQTERERLEMFCQQGVSGILLCPWAEEKEECFYTTLPVPYVVIGRQLKQVKADTVLVNNQYAAQEMAGHLIRRGYRNFAYIGQSGRVRDPRLQGFRFGLMESGCSLSDESVLSIDYSDTERMKESVLLLLRRVRKERTAIFCYHDLFASMTLNLCHQEGIRVPDEIGVAGFDDLPVAAELYPPLTTVRYPLKDMARIASETLFAQMNHPHGARRGVCRYLESEIVIREST